MSALPPVTDVGRRIVEHFRNTLPGGRHLIPFFYEDRLLVYANASRPKGGASAGAFLPASSIYPSIAGSRQARGSRAASPRSVTPTAISATSLVLASGGTPLGGVAIAAIAGGAGATVGAALAGIVYIRRTSGA